MTDIVSTETGEVFETFDKLYMGENKKRINGYLKLKNLEFVQLEIGWNGKDTVWVKEGKA